MEKLDALMGLTLDALGHALAAGQGASLRPVLLRIFEATILPAHRTKFCQYLLWFLCAQVRLPSCPCLQHRLL